jgi:hypothetical protein
MIVKKRRQDLSPGVAVLRPYEDYYVSEGRL